MMTDEFMEGNEMPGGKIRMRYGDWCEVLGEKQS